MTWGVEEDVEITSSSYRVPNHGCLVKPLDGCWSCTLISLWRLNDNEIRPGQ